MTPKKGKICYLCSCEPLGGRVPSQTCPVEWEALGLTSCCSLGLIPPFHCTERKICAVTGVKGRPGTAFLLNKGLILSPVGQSTLAG